MSGSTGLHFAFLMKHELPRNSVVIDHGHSSLSKRMENGNELAEPRAAILVVSSDDEA